MQTSFLSFSSRRNRLFIVCVLLLVSVAFCCAKDEEETWQQCEIFMAPSSMGWGVFAARPFQQGEIVEMAAGFVPMSEDSPAIYNSVLDDYVYGYWRIVDRSIEKLFVVMLGTDMFYNHHPRPNLEYTTFGREPARDVPNTSNSIGFMASRDIQLGEQLFASYGKEDGGRDWFSRREIPMQNLREDAISLDDLPSYKTDYCSKIYAGIGLPTWRDRILPILPKEGLPFWIDLARLAPFDAGMGDAKAKVDIEQGERIEITTGLVTSKKLYDGSALSTILISWEDLGDEHQTALQKLREHGQLRLQYQGDDTSWKRIERFESLQDLAILPVAGNIGLVRRVGSSKNGSPNNTTSNCRLVIHSEATPGSTVGITVELIATQKIRSGETLTLDLPPAGTKPELDLLEEELKLTGRPYYNGLFSDSRDEL